MSFDAEESRLLNKSLNIREKIIDQLMVNGKIPNDKEDREFLIKALDGSDRTILGRKRIKVEEDAGKRMEGIQDMVAQVILNTTRAANLRAQNATAPKLPDEVKVGEIVPGEMDIGVSKTNYEDFMKKMNDQA